MLPIRTILFATDFSAPSNHAFSLACALARDYEARLLVVHVKPPLQMGGAEFAVIPVEPPGYTEELRKQLSQVRPSEDNIAIQHYLGEGDPAAEIIRLARERACDLIVMGTHGRTGLGRLLLGSIAELVLRRAPCPVLTVKVPAPEPATRPAARPAEVARN